MTSQLFLKMLTDDNYNNNLCVQWLQKGKSRSRHSREGIIWIIRLTWEPPPAPTTSLRHNLSILDCTGNGKRNLNLPVLRDEIWPYSYDAVINPQGQGNLEKKQFMLFHSSRGRVLNGKEDRKLADHIFIQTQEAVKREEEVGWDYKLSMPTPSDVLPSEDCASQRDPHSTTNWGWSAQT